jgi:ubiquinone biosynthesis protein COQ9
MAVITLNPSFAMQAIENLLRLCDEIWYQVGDQSTDVDILMIFLLFCC